MAGVSELIVKYKADISDLQGKVEKIEATMKKAEKAGTDAAKNTEAAFKKTSESAGSLGDKLESLGKTILAAFAIERIIAFGNACIKAFEEAEKSAIKLKSAVGVSGGLQKDFDKLIQQSKELQKTTIFSDENIQGVQTAALQFGLTADQVEKLLPLITDFASATGQDLKSALDNVLRGVEGQTRGLKLYGVSLTEGQSRSENLAQITQQLTEKFNGQAEAIGETAFGAAEKYKNQLDDLQEVIGARLAPKIQGLRGFFLDLAEAGTQAFDDLGSAFDKIFGIANQTGGTKTSLDKLAEATIEAKRNFDALGLSQEQAEDKIDNIAERRRELLEKVKTDTGIQLELDSQQILILRAQETALQQIVAERKKGIPAAKEEFNIAKSTTEELKKRLEIDSGKSDLKSRDEADAITKEIARRQKASEQKTKLDADTAAAQEKQTETLREFTLKSLIDNLTEEEAALKLDASNKIAIKEDLDKRLSEIELQRLEKERALLIEFGKPTADTDKQIADNKINTNKKAADEVTKTWEEALKEIQKNADDFDKEQAKKDKDAKDLRIKTAQETFDQIVALEQQLNEFVSQTALTASGNRIASLESERDSALAGIDAEVAALEKANNEKRISQRKYEAEKIRLATQRAAKEKEIEDKINAEKKKQAIRERELAIFNIILHTAEAMMKVAAETGILTFAFSPLIAALGALQIATVLAAPLPKFAKGTKGAHGSMSIVGEEGPEMMFVPTGAKILPAEKTRRYGSLIDAMYDNRLDEYLGKMYIAPALKRQQELSEKKRQETFASNIANSFMLHKNGELDQYGMLWALTKGNENLPKEIAKELHKLSQKSYSAYS